MKQHQHARIISQRIIHSRLYKHSRHIALYLPTDGEVDLSPLIHKLQSYSKKCYLPVILSRRHAIMAFAPYEKHTRLRKNCFGILEPVFQKKQLKTAKQMDLVLAPLVGFDEQGNRMGMGGGFYDRALQHLKVNNAHLSEAHCSKSSCSKPSVLKASVLKSSVSRPSFSKPSFSKPKFIGIAHELQKVTQLQSQSWDIALNAIVTERRLSYFH